MFRFLLNCVKKCLYTRIYISTFCVDYFVCFNFLVYEN